MLVSKVHGANLDLLRLILVGIVGLWQQQTSPKTSIFRSLNSEKKHFGDFASTTNLAKGHGTRMVESEGEAVDLMPQAFSDQALGRLALLKPRGRIFQRPVEALLGTVGTPGCCEVFRRKPCFQPASTRVFSRGLCASGQLDRVLVRRECDRA